MVNKGADKFLGCQSCSWDKISHFGYTTDDDKEVLVFSA